MSNTPEPGLLSLPSELLLQIVAHLSIKSRLFLGCVSRRLCSLMEGEVCWDGFDRLEVVARESGWWFEINGCRIRGSRKAPPLLIREIVHHVTRNVCAALEAMFRRISVRKIYLDDVSCITNRDILLTLAGLVTHEQSKHEVHTLEMVLRYPHGLAQPLLFRIFKPLTASLRKVRFYVLPPIGDQFPLYFRVRYSVLIGPSTMTSFWHLVKLCAQLKKFHFDPFYMFSGIELAALRGKPLTKLVLNTRRKRLSQEEEIGIYDSLATTLTELGLFGSAPNIRDLNRNHLRKVQCGFYDQLDFSVAEQELTAVAQIPTIRDIIFWFDHPFSSEHLVTLATIVLNNAQQLENKQQDLTRTVTFQVLSNEEKETFADHMKRWQSMAENLQQQQINFEMSCNNKPHKFKRLGLVRYEPFVTWYMLSKENVSVRLYCNFLPNY